MDNNEIVIIYSNFWNELDVNKFIIVKRLRELGYNVKLVHPDLNHTILKPQCWIYSLFGRSIPRLAKFDGLKIFYSGEKQLNDKYADIVTSSLRRSDDFKSAPIRIYERLHYELFNRLDPYKFLVCNPFGNIQKDRFCAFVVSNSTSKTRNTIFEYLNNAKKVDSLGAYKRNCNYVIPGRIEGEYSYQKAIARYKFMICGENTSREDYLTEKLYNALLANTIPIYWGDPNYCKIFNPERIIYCPTCDEWSRQVHEVNKVVDRVLYLENNPDEYQKMLSQPAVIDPDALDKEYCENLDFVISKITNTSTSTT